MLTRRHRVRRFRHNASLIALNVAGIGACALGATVGAFLGWDAAQIAVNTLAEPWKAQIAANALSYAPALLGLGLGTSIASALTERFSRAATRLTPAASPLVHEIVDTLHDSTRLMGMWAIGAGAALTGLETGIALAVYGATGISTLVPPVSLSAKFTMGATWMGGLCTGLVTTALAAEAAFNVTEKLRGQDNRVYMGGRPHHYFPM